MTDIIDISMPLRPRMPTWPGSVGVRLMRTMRLEAGDPANISRLDCDVHAGTHVDAPWHFLKKGNTAEQFPLNTLIGPAIIVYLPKVDVITAGNLTGPALPSKVKRLLLCTRNSELWVAGVNKSRKNYVALTADAARSVVDKGIRLLGVDYLSVHRYDDSPLTHQILLEADVIILEGLNLADVQPGIYEFICLPLRLVGAEAAPARAILRRMSNVSDQSITGESL